VKFGGQRLDDTRQIIVYTEGIEVASLGEVKSDSVKATLRIAPDCRLGEHQLRLRTATGISELRTFWVGAMTNLTEAEPNNDLAKAQAVPLNTTVSGTITSEDIDCFHVSAAKGTRLNIEIEGMRLGRGAFDPHLAILNAKGATLAAAEDSPLLQQDAAVALLAPEDGDYIIQVRETSFGGRDDFHYRLHVGSFPRPLAVYPPAGKTGETLPVRFIGDIAGDFTQTVTLPKTRQDKFGLFAEQPSTIESNPKSESESQIPNPKSQILSAPSANWIRVTPHPVVQETEPNNTREQAASASPAPVVFTGILEKPGDEDWFRFRARKGDTLVVSVFGRRLRSPIDSVIQVVNPKGGLVADNDDAGGPDSTVTLKPDEDGEYAVLVRDHLRRGGPTYVYALEIAPAEPSITVKIPDIARNDTQTRQYITVPRGNCFGTLISARRANVSGELSLRMDGLPAGMKMLAQALPPNVDQFPVVFEATPDAALNGRLLELVATATNGVSGRYRNDIELVAGPNNTTFFGTRVDRLLVAVTEPAPFRVRLVEPHVPLVQGGSMELRVVAEREAEFDEPITLKMIWNPPGISSSTEVTMPKGATNVTYTLNAKMDAEKRAWPVAVIASAKVKGGDLFVATPLAQLEVAAPFLTAKIETATCAPGHATNITVRLEQQIPFEGSATIRLVGLPEKVTAPTQQITKDAKEVTFPIEVDATCPTGSHRNLFCAVAVKQNGEEIPHSVGQGGVFRIVAPKKPAATEPKKVAKN